MYVFLLLISTLFICDRIYKLERILIRENLYVNNTKNISTQTDREEIEKREILRYFKD